MTDLILLVNPRLLSMGIDGMERVLRVDPATAEAASSMVSFTDLLPVHLDPRGFLSSLLTGSEEGPTFPFLRHLGLAHILSFYEYEASWSAEAGFWDAISPTFAGVPNLAQGPWEALEEFCTTSEGKRALILFSSSVEPRHILKLVGSSARAGRTCMAFIGVPGALLDPSLAERAHHICLRFPASICFPGRLPARRVTVPLSAMDFLPTLLETLGLPPFLRKDVLPILGTSHFSRILDGTEVVPGNHHAWLPGKSLRVSQRGMEKLVVDNTGLRLHFIDRDPDENADVHKENRDTWVELVDSLLKAEDRLLPAP